MYLDADVLYAHLKPTDWLKKHAEEIVKLPSLITSAITVVELQLISKRDFDNDFSNSVLGNLQKLKNLTILPLTQSLLESATHLRTQYELNIFDALHAACALQERRILVSSDHAFDTIPSLQRKDPRTF